MKGIDYLNSLPQWRQGAFSPLEIPQKILAALANPQDKIKTIHVAGTNGKGTTCAAISKLLTESGFKTGFYSSPHLIEVEERCRINGKPITTEKFDYYLSKVAEVVNWDTNAMTYFVATTCASFLCFAEEQVDYAVIEVGLGGKFDATNLITKPELGIITSIDFDHVELLGPTIADIAANKAGIIKPKSKLLIGELEQEAKDVILKIAKENNTQVFESSSFQIKAKTELMRSEIGKKAAQLAATAIQILNLDLKVEKLEDLVWPGRLQEVCYKSKKIILDGAHNPAGIRKLIQHLFDFYHDKKIIIYVGLKKREGWEQTAEELLKGIKKLNAELRVVDWDQSADFEQTALMSYPKVDLEDIIEKELNNIIVVTGSLYLVGQLLSKLSYQ